MTIGLCLLHRYMNNLDKGTRGSLLANIYSFQVNSIFASQTNSSYRYSPYLYQIYSLVWIFAFRNLLFPSDLLISARSKFIDRSNELTNEKKHFFLLGNNEYLRQMSIWFLCIRVFFLGCCMIKNYELFDLRAIISS